MRTHPVDKLLEQHWYKSDAGLLQLVRFYVCSRVRPNKDVNHVGSLDLGLLVLQYLHFLIFSAFSHEKTGTR